MVPQMTKEEAKEWYEAAIDLPFITDELLEIFRNHFGLNG